MSIRILVHRNCDKLRIDEINHSIQCSVDNLVFAVLTHFAYSVPLNRVGIVALFIQSKLSTDKVCALEMFETYLVISDGNTLLNMAVDSSKHFGKLML